MSYPGNSSLPQDVQDRISSTYRQTLELLGQQRDQEALLGCEFILRLDPQHRPAQQLLAQLRSASERAASPAPASPQAAPASPRVAPAAASDFDDFADLDSLGNEFDGLSLDSQPMQGGTPAVATTPSAPLSAPPPSIAPSPLGGLGSVLQDLLDRRNFKQILQIAETQKDAINKNPQLLKMVQAASSRLESEPFVLKFLHAARRAQAAGQMDQANKELEKARSLDPEHPEVLTLAAAFKNVEPAPTMAAPASTPNPSATGPDALQIDQQDQPLVFGDSATVAAAPPGGDDTWPVLDPSAGEEIAPVAPPAQSVEPFSDGSESAFGNSEVGQEVSFAGTTVEAPRPADFDDFIEPTLETPLAADDGLGIDAESSSLGDEGFEQREADLAPMSTGDESSQDEGIGRIGQLLGEGQEAFERGEYQAAIDVWSRIFLIEIDNAEASRRIEEARNRRAELERQAEESFHDGVSHLERQSIDEAKAAFGRVLELQPGHGLAREYLDQLEAGQMPTIRRSSELADSEIDADLAELAAASTAVADSGKSLEAAVERDRVVVVKKTDKRLIVVGAAVLLAVIGLVGFLVLKWDELFPNSETPPPTAVRQVDPIERATKMHEAGNTENALVLLERLPPIDPQFENAQALIAQWKALIETPPVVADAGPPEEQMNRRLLLISAAREAHGQGHYLRSQKYFERAAKVAPLETDDLALKRDATEQLAPLKSEIDLYDRGEYAAVIPELWRRREARPQDKDVERLLVDSYYNLALRDLQRGDTQSAARKLGEAVSVATDAQDLERLRRFAQTYTSRSQDLLYRIYVKYLPSR